MLRHAGLLIVLSTACSPSASDPRDILDGKADDLDPSEIPTLATTYKVDVRSLIDFCEGSGETCSDDRETAEVEALARLTLSQDGAEVAGQIELCFAMLTTPAGKRYATDSGVFSEGDPSATIAPIQFSGRVIGVDGAPTLALDPSAMVVGMTLDDVVNDALVADKNAPGVDDIDGDGKPGISLMTPVGRVFLGARVTIERLRAEVGDDGVLGGAADMRADFVVYDDSIPFVNVRKKVDESIGDYIFPDVTHAVTMTADDRDCATL